MTRDVVTALPRSPRSLTCCCRKVLSCIAHAFAHFWILQQLALPSSEPKPAIDDRRPEKPLRDKHPPQRHNAVPQPRPYPPYRQSPPKPRPQRQKHGKRRRSPKPSLLDKVHVEDVLFLREVRWREGRIMRLQDGRVGRVARTGLEDAEDGAEEEGERVDCEELRFETGGEEGRARGGSGVDCGGGHGGSYWCGLAVGGGSGSFASCCHSVFRDDE